MTFSQGFFTEIRHYFYKPVNEKLLPGVFGIMNYDLWIIKEDFEFWIS